MFFLKLFERSLLITVKGDGYFADTICKVWCINIVLGYVRLTGIRINGIIVRFLFLSKFGHTFQQTFTDAR